jgi:hypothetical protein
MKWVLVATGLVGAMALAVALVNGWLKWRKRAMQEAGARLGLHALAEGERLMVPLVPLIHRPRRRYLLILKGVIHGHDGAFFDLFVGEGEHWNVQSAVLLRGAGVAMPGFQLVAPRWSTITQRTRGQRVDLAGREHEMRGLKLTSDDPDWARSVFSRASGGLLERVRKGKWSIEGFGNALVVYQWTARIPARRLESYLRQAAELGAETLSLCGQDGGG